MNVVKRIREWLDQFSYFFFVFSLSPTESTINKQINKKIALLNFDY